MKYRIVQYFDYFLVEKEYKQIHYPNIICELFKCFGVQKIKWNPIKKCKFESEAKKAIEAFKFNENPKIIEVD